jgi:hypothetical protein
VRQEVETFHRFRALSEQLLQINEEICERRPRPAEEAVKKLRGVSVSSYLFVSNRLATDSSPS